jgi:hypothetical protein
LALSSHSAGERVTQEFSVASRTADHCSVPLEAAPILLFLGDRTGRHSGNAARETSTPAADFCTLIRNFEAIARA